MQSSYSTVLRKRKFYNQINRTKKHLSYLLSSVGGTLVQELVDSVEGPFYKPVCQTFLRGVFQHLQFMMQAVVESRYMIGEFFSQNDR